MYFIPNTYYSSYTPCLPTYNQDERFCAFPFLGIGLGLLGGFAAGALVSRPYGYGYYPPPYPQSYPQPYPLPYPYPVPYQTPSPQQPYYPQQQYSPQQYPNTLTNYPTQTYPALSNSHTNV